MRVSIFITIIHNFAVVNFKICAYLQEMRDINSVKASDPPAKKAGFAGHYIFKKDCFRQFILFRL